MQTGIIKHLNYDITSPVTFKSMDINFRNLNLLTGPNGVGKSFIMASAWALNSIALLMVKGGLPKPILILSAQDILNTTLRSPVSGIMSIVYENEGLLTVHCNNGIVEDITTLDFEKITDVAPITYMSAKLRLFENIDMFFNTQRLLKQTLGEEGVLIELVKYYPLYDISYCQSLDASLPIKIGPTTRERLKEFEIPEFYSINRDDKGFYAEDEHHKVTYLSTLSNGHQSILNMMVGQSLGLGKGREI